MNKIVLEEIEKHIDKELIKKFSNSTVLITGATGLIGQTLAYSFLILAKEMNIHLILLGRSLAKLEKCYMDFVDSNISFIENDIRDQLDCSFEVDYIIHSASMTSSSDFINHPVDVIDTSYIGTRNMLELAKKKNVKSFIYLSSMEVYGFPTIEEPITETHSNNIDSMSIRSSYPESKRICEALCNSYHSQYNVPVKVLRLTQTFGPGILKQDNRFFGMLVRSIISNKDIVLKTKGKTRRNYLYTVDAVNAILTALYKGQNGEAYNVANESTYCSIYEMAQMATKVYENSSFKVTVNEDKSGKTGYAPDLFMALDSTKLRELGWKPFANINHMLYKTAVALEQDISDEQ